MDSIEDYGYDKFLNRIKSQTDETNEEISQFSADEFDFSVANISANKINSGMATSLNNQLQIDFDTGAITLKDGGITKAEFKKFLDSRFGLRIYNADGTTLIDQTG